MQKGIYFRRKTVDSSSREPAWHLQRTRGNRQYVFSRSCCNLTWTTQWKSLSLLCPLVLQFCQSKLFQCLYPTFQQWNNSYYPVKKAHLSPGTKTEVQKTIYTTWHGAVRILPTVKVTTMTIEVYTMHGATLLCSRYQWCSVPLNILSHLTWQPTLEVAYMIMAILQIRKQAQKCSRK